MANARKDDARHLKQLSETVGTILVMREWGIGDWKQAKMTYKLSQNI